MNRLIAALLLAWALPAGAQIVAATPRGVMTAHDGKIEMFDPRGTVIWSTAGVENATAIVAGEQRAAVLDAWDNRVRIVSLRDGSGMTVVTAETPIDGVFLGGDLYLLARDARLLERFGADGTRSSAALPADPAMLAEWGGTLYVYSRTAGVLHEVDAAGVARRRALVGPFAAAMEVDGRTAYLVFPGEAKLVAVDLEKMEVRRRVDAGGAPTGVALTRRASPINGPQLAVADPAAKRLWITEGAQSFGAAFARGFVRGLLGMGAFRPRSSDFPTGVDRVMSAGGVTLAYDSSARVLYRVGRSGVQRIAEGVPPQGFAIAGERVALWAAGSLHYRD